MTKIATPSIKNSTNGNGKENGNGAAVVKQAVALIGEKKAEEKLPEPVKVIPAEEPKKELTLIEKILKVENLQLVIEKRGKLVQTRSELERFQTASNDFNCQMNLKDSDGNLFSTTFTPGIKKVVEFLKTQFDASIADVEKKINF